MNYTRIYTGRDGQSHFEDGALELFDIEIGKITGNIAVDHLYFGEVSEGKKVDWHNPPVPQFVIMLQGAMEIETGDGSKRVFDTGDIVLIEDTDGQGHITRAVGSGKHIYMVLPRP